MRYKPEHKAETHQRIVDVAAAEFRTHGFEGVGIAKLMGALNLTHGGFYAQFSDKEALVTESLEMALHQSLETLMNALAEGGLIAMIECYLSQEHRDNPALGCPLPTLSAEIARRPTSSRASFTGNLSEFFDVLAQHMPGPTSQEKHSQVYAMFAAMVGAISLARSVSDSSLSKAILESTRQNLVSFVKEKTS